MSNEGVSFIESLDAGLVKDLALRLDSFIVDHASVAQRPLALVTSGGTAVDLEVNAVRSLDNFSTGLRGSMITEQLLASGYAVVFLQRTGSASPFSRVLHQYLRTQANHGLSTDCFHKLFGNNDDDDDDAEDDLERMYNSWFPPMRTVLRVLSKIFRVVEPIVFEDMARTAVQSCTASLKHGAAYIQKRKGNLDSDLFLVKHLLILREQLSPFDLEWQTVERQLDFSEAGRAVSRFWANRNRRVFSMSTNENALVLLLREGVSIQESRVDSKRDLEEALRSACNDFISHTTEYVLGDVVKLTGDSDNLNAGNVAAFVASLDKSVDQMENNVETVQAKISLYLESAATQSILLKPVCRKIARAAEELRKKAQSWSEIEESEGEVSKAQELVTRIEALAKRVGKPCRT